MKKKCAASFAAALIIMLCLPITAAAEVLDKYADPVQVVRSGSFETTDKTKMDFSFDGGTLSGAKWTVVRHGASYSLEGTFKEGENVSLSVVGTESPLPDSSGRVFNYMKVELSFLDINYKTIGEKQTYFSGYVKDATLSHTISGSVPTGTAQVKISGVYNCRWAGQVVVEEGVAVYITLKAEKAPAVVLPTESKPQSQDPQSSSPSVPEQEFPSEPRDEDPLDSDSPWEHAGPMATALISVVAGIAAVIGAAAGSPLAGASAATPQDPAYERAKVPDYPDFVVGWDGERLTKRPDGIIEASFPNGDVAVHFPNGTVQLRNPDGTTWEEWPNGTLSTTKDGVFITKEPDGTQTEREANGEEIVYKPDGTSIRTTTDGLKITKNEAGETTSVERDGFVITRHPHDPEAKVMTSPYGGSVVIREKQKEEMFLNEHNKWENRTVSEPTFEGELRSEYGSHKYRPDGSIEYKGNDGSVGTQDKDGNVDLRGADGTTYQKYANGSMNASMPDGTKLNYDSITGEIDYKSSDGTYLKGNEHTGELDAKLPDGSYAKRDAQGNGHFIDKKSGTRGEYQSDGSMKQETDDASMTRTADGTQEFKTKTGVQVTQKSDGTVTTSLPDGRSSLDTPDGTKMVKMPDGTTFTKSPDGGTRIQRPDGSVQQTTQQDYDRELDRYNDWYNKQLEQWLKK